MHTPATIPELAPKLRTKTEELSRQLPRIVERVFMAVSMVDPAYLNFPEALQQDVRNNVDFSCGLWFKTLLSGTTPSTDDLEILAEFGRRRVHQGLPLTALLRAFRVGSGELWRITLELGATDGDVRDGLLFSVSPYLLEHFDHMAQAITTAYLEEQYQHARWREALRSELVCLVFSFPDDVAEFSRVCGALGIDATIPRVALALDIATPDVLPSRMESELDLLVLAIARQMKIAPDELVRTMHRGRLVIWVPTRRGESILATDRQFQGYAGALVRTVPEIRAVGVGLMSEGAAGWAASVDEAFKALEAGRRHGKGPPVFLFSDVAVSDSVLRSGNVLRYLNSLLERIAVEPELLSTLATYFDRGQHRKPTAAALGIHPNTLNYRLDRIESILGARLDDAGWISRLDVAVRLRRLSHIPER